MITLLALGVPFSEPDLPLTVAGEFRDRAALAAHWRSLGIDPHLALQAQQHQKTVLGIRGNGKHSMISAWLATALVQLLLR